MKTIKVGSDFSGVGAFDYAIGRVAEQKGFKVENVFACDMDKHARKSYLANHGDPGYYPENVYEREIPTESLDVYMTSPPCQAFSMAGARQGKNDPRGILFFNSLEFIEKNQPRFFIFENVKGLLSDDNGKTFSEWINLLGGKSVNGLPVLFPYENAVNYHIYWQVLNAKEHGIPQNRERVFIIGIRDDSDNHFRFPKTEHLEKRLKDVLEDSVDEKYFLSKKMINYISKDRSGNKNLIVNREVANTITCEIKKMQRSMQDNYVDEASVFFDCKYNIEGCINTVLKHKLKGLCDICENGDEFVSIEDINVMSRKFNDDVIQLNQSKESGGVQPYQQNRVYHSNGISPALNAGQEMWGGNIVTLPNELKIRRLTPRECFRLMDFPESFKFVVSDSQLYKQAGNSIVVRVLEKILNNLNL